MHSLFRYDVALADTAGALLKLDTQPGRRAAIEDDFLTLFGRQQESLTMKGQRGVYEIDWDGVRCPLSSWADGYRLFFQWFVDLHTLAFEQGAGTELAGVLLVDELEQHLHPELQGTILSRLQAAFPNVLIVATTHSPLVTLGSSPECLIVLRRQGGQIVRVPAPSFQGLTVEDVVTHSRLFDASPYPLEKQEKLARWNELMQIPADQITAADRTELRSLTDQLLSA